jgi:jagged-like protein
VLLLQYACGSGFFELQILEIANYRSELASGACCGSQARPDSSVPCPRPCSTFFRVCLKEYQSNVTSTGSCSFGNTSSPVLGGSSFTLADPDRANGKLVVPFIFRWTVSTIIMQHALPPSTYATLHTARGTEFQPVQILKHLSVAVFVHLHLMR